MDKPIVLIVDGEALIRVSAVHMVEDAGFSALEASNTDDAIKLFESRRDIQAVFTDINMSGSMDEPASYAAARSGVKLIGKRVIALNQIDRNHLGSPLIR